MNNVMFECDLDGVSYPIFAGDIFSNIDEYVARVYKGNQVLIVIDEVVDQMYGETIYPLLRERFDLNIHVITGGKDSKTISSILKIFNVLEDENFSRDSLMIGIGGGVIGDMAGFAAGCWYRGMKLIHIPTTLLSAVDSCLGGKTAINLNDTVNAIGSYYHPIEILIDTNVIRALPKREISSGIGEVIKYAVIHSETICDALEKKDYQDVLSEIDWFIVESLKNKEHFVRGDISEGHKRLYLNFGHTLGHAIESSLNYKGISHGEAVSIGMLFASAISVEKSDLKIDEFNLIENTLANFSLPVRIPSSVTGAKILKNMTYDKKNKQGKINFVLLTSIGSCCLNDHISDRYILGLLKTFQS